MKQYKRHIFKKFYFLSLLAFGLPIMLFGCRSGDGNGNGGENGSPGTKADRPEMPRNFTATASGTARGQITLNWDTEPGVSYDLFHSRVAGAGVQGTGVMRISNVTPPYEHTGLMDGTTYYYYLTANNSSGASAPTAEMSATTLPAPMPLAPPETPGSFTATPGNGKVTLNWTALPNVTYTLYYSTDSGFSLANGRPPPPPAPTPL